jgi:hypothetical protein
MRLTACFQHNEKQGYPPEIFPELCSDMILQTAEALSSLSGRYTYLVFLFKLIAKCSGYFHQPYILEKSANESNFDIRFVVLATQFVTVVAAPFSDDRLITCLIIKYVQAVPTNFAAHADSIILQSRVAISLLRLRMRTF